MLPTRDIRFLAARHRDLRMLARMLARRAVPRTLLASATTGRIRAAGSIQREDGVRDA